MTETNGHGPRRTQRTAQPVQSPPMSVLQAEFDRLLQSNQERLIALQREGTGLDPLSFVHARIDKLINSIAEFAGPNGPRWALLARLAFEQHLDQEIADAAAQSRRVQLSLGASYTPGMIAELARQTGTFRKTHG